MDRTACINLPAFRVQLLLRRHPDWKNQPVAVVDSDKPQGTILQVNEHARSFRILPGMRYAAGLALDGSLRAAVVLEKEVKKAIIFITDRLRSFSPRVEPAADEPGIFWLDASGLERLYGSLSIWTKSIQRVMNRSGFHVSIVVGFNRFGSYTIAKAKHGVWVIRNPYDEQIASRKVSIDCLGLEPKTRDLLEKLGVKTVGQFINLPPNGVTRRLGLQAYRLHQLAFGELRLPLQPEYPKPPAMQRRVLDYPEIDIGRIIAVIQQLLHPLLQKLSGRGHALTEVQIWFRFERIGEHVERIRPAAPTLNARQLLELIRLRLHSINTLSDGIIEIALVGQSVAAIPKQLRLLEAHPKRDLAAANRALARVRADLGDQAVVRARLREGHLPEGRFVWETFDTLSVARPRKGQAIRLMRRIRDIPTSLLWCPRRKPKKTKLSALQMETAEPIFGPYIISGGWWQRPVHREYYFAETRLGDVQWVYYDPMRKSWFQQGRVE